MIEEQTSLERFLRNRGIAFLATSTMTRRGFILQSRIGFASFGLGAALFACGVFSHNPSDQMALCLSSTGPFFAGFINVLASTILQRRYTDSPPEIKLAREDRQFLTHLARQVFGRQFDFYQPTPGFSRSRPSAWSVIAKKSPRDILPLDLFQILEEASYHYNRIYGILQSATEGSPTKKLASGSQLAADEAMVDILHQASIISRFPESAMAANSLANLRIESLTELGDRLESLQGRTPSLTDRLGSGSAMENVLEELRLNDLARAELMGKPFDNQELNG